MHVFHRNSKPLAKSWVPLEVESETRENSPRVVLVAEGARDNPFVTLFLVFLKKVLPVNESGNSIAKF